MAAGSKTSQKRRQTISHAYRVHAYVVYSHIFMMYVRKSLHEVRIYYAVCGVLKRQLNLYKCFDLQQWGPYWKGVVFTGHRSGGCGTPSVLPTRRVTNSIWLIHFSCSRLQGCPEGDFCDPSHPAKAVVTGDNWTS